MALVNGIVGSYQLRFQFGDQDLVLTPSSMSHFQIELYIDRFLPTISCELRDESGFLTNLTPFDSRYNRINVNFNNDTDSEDDSTNITFKIFRRKPSSIVQMSNNIIFNGILDIPNLFSPRYQQGFVNVAVDEVVDAVLDVTTFDEVNTSVGFPAVTVLQPNWTNAQFLTFLAGHVKTTSGEAALLTFTDLPGFLKTRFNFVALTQLLEQIPSFTFVNAPTSTNPTILPIYKIDIFDNFDLIANMGVSQQQYGYFDYFSGKYILRTITLAEIDFNCLSEYFAYDSGDNIQGLSQTYTGVTNDFISDYDAVARGSYYKKLNSLVKMWITTNGNNAINPGIIVKVVFPEVNDGASVVSYQYAGNWLVERVRHNFGSSYTTSLLLTRPGYDTDQPTTFVKAASD